MSNPSAARPTHLRDPLLLLALGFGSGLARRGPGTAGTVVGVGLYLLIAPLPVAAVVALTVVVAVAGIPLCGYAARRLRVHDDPAIVWDEIAGYLVTMLLLPGGWPWVIAGFVLFRLFDIAKPWPIGWLDRRVSGGTGIMVDDILAGAFACLVLHLVRLAIA
ncbi:phosphatidylglycerophosphatase A family protein [Halofilum ochraceum]|uniref:phosphatidylglycerophosphatase A family protein n=1 Tax=Halofilum ochraceum TaxID=1611323 RepID=UPI0008D94A5A|nr:phosphatidylglycerophosphatase A [Halofilum ochraceum]